MSNYCFILPKHNFDDLYAGLLKDAKETTFEQTVAQMESLDALLQFLDDSFEKEQTKQKKYAVST